MRYVLTAAMLRERGATCAQVDAFEAEWPDGATPTKKNFLRAVALGLDLGWLADNFLPSAAVDVYRKAVVAAAAAYAKAGVAALAAYRKATAPAAAVYARAEAAALVASRKAAAMALWRVARELLAKGEETDASPVAPE